MNKTCFIINPISGVQRKRSVVAAIDSVFSRRNEKYSLLFTTETERGEVMCTRAIQEGFTTVVAVGGDGTVHEIGKTLVNTNVALGILPLGSGNGLARELGIPLNLDDAISNILDGNVFCIDTLLVNNHSFLGVAGVGFDAHVANEFSLEKTRGLQTYTKIVLTEFTKFKSSNYKVSFNDKSHQFDAFLITIANSGQYGNNAHIAPHAKINDGKFKICIMKDFPALQAPGLAARLFLRNIDQSKYYETYETTSCVIEQNEDLVQLDGDVFELGKKLHFSIQPNSLKVIVPTLNT